MAHERDRGVRQVLIERAERGPLQKRDVQRLRRELRAARVDERAGGQPTLREVAATLGAAEAQIRAAAVARRDEPELSDAEALSLVMHAPALPQEPVPPQSAGADAVPQAGTPQGPAQEETALVAAAGGPAAVRPLLQWAIERQLSIAALLDRMEQERGGAVL